MQLRLNDPEYIERLASFLESLGQATIISGPNEIELLIPEEKRSEQIVQREIGIYLRVWAVLYPDAEVTIVESSTPSPSEVQPVNAH